MSIGLHKLQKRCLGACCKDRAKAPACSSKPQSSSPLYPKTKAVGFTGRSYKAVTNLAECDIHDSPDGCPSGVISVASGQCLAGHQ